MRVRIPRQRGDIERLDRPLPEGLSRPAPRILRAPRPRAPRPAEDPLLDYRLVVTRTLIRHRPAEAGECGCGVPVPCPVRAHAARLLEWV
ncbi:hypothetical protein ACIBSV_19325 [Embleya sp. NPDC050154]|uniref:hypothetical protein n=1 Tax=unclassified Embleya TaxID=2699296 RepID=UPI0037A69E8B|nr:hypothetical protein OG948_20170 [Embleya sp. NBC_00888]